MTTKNQSFSSMIAEMKKYQIQLEELNMRELMSAMKLFKVCKIRS